MASYIEKFSSTIRKKQTEQILKLLNKQRSTGQIRTVEEFTSKLESLVRELTSTNITPTLKLLEAEKSEHIDSESFNFNLDRVEDDLTTAFGEAYNIDQVQKAHQAIVRDVLLKNLKHGIDELESKVDLYEFLQNDKNGFTTSLFSTFREAKAGRLSRSSDKQIATLFNDPRTGLPMTLGKDDAAIDLIGERLTLGFQAKESFLPRSVSQLFDNETTVSSDIVTRPGTELRNMIDGQSGTYWVQSVLTKWGTSYFTKLVTKLEFDLPGTRTINYLEIVPANVLPFKLKKVYYVSSSNLVELLASPDLLITGPMSYIFPTTTTGKIILEFESFTKRNISFQKKENQFIWLASLNKNEQTIQPTSTIQQIQLSPNVFNSVQLLKTQPPVRTFFGSSFEIGFDNISFGKGGYSNKSIYVSNGLTLKDPLQVGLKTIEKRPSSESLIVEPSMNETTYDADDDLFFHGSIEYWMIKRDFDEKDNIVATYKVPILPTGVERVHHERLVFTERSGSSVFLPDTGSLMFFADNEVSDIVVYKNGNPISSGEWEDVTTDDDRTPNTGTRMRYKIKVKNIMTGDIFTVSYTPVESSTISVPVVLSEYSSDGISVIDLAGNMSARVVKDQLIILDKGPQPEKVAKTIIYLAIVLRNNTSNISLTPAVEEYTLVVGEKNLEKFDESAF